MFQSSYYQINNHNYDEIAKKKINLFYATVLNKAIQ